MNDFTFTNHGTIGLLDPLTPDAEAWCVEHLPDDCQMLGDAYAIEPRFASDIIEGIVNDGLALTLH